MPTVSPQDPALEPFDYEQFEQEVYELVRDTAPRLFAVVVEYRAGTKDADAAVVAWGLAHESGAEVIQPGSGSRWSLASPEHVARYFGRADGCSPRLVWLAPPDGDGRVQDRAA
ncbi:hypothetical protein [Streptomyces scopuliridis]|uniref:hypothetical protein n=1 Tax=Streptomyces scopuliridis TaxID=452529 RepID=UPI00369309D0